MENIIESIKASRQQEIKDGKNLFTSYPLYIVYDIVETFVDENTDNNQSISFHEFITCCFTMQAAEDFIWREKHNLKNPQIWVGHIPWRNFELREILKILGDN
ncbi:MAG: hypothetical protein AB1472_07055 [Candidatus Omnitrophota bacterium]